MIPNIGILITHLQHPHNENNSKVKPQNNTAQTNQQGEQMAMSKKSADITPATTTRVQNCFLVQISPFGPRGAESLPRRTGRCLTRRRTGQRVIE
jgi:hypothetical protein